MKTMRMMSLRRERIRRSKASPLRWMKELQGINKDRENSLRRPATRTQRARTWRKESETGEEERVVSPIVSAAALDVRDQAGADGLVMGGWVTDGRRRGATALCQIPPKPGHNPATTRPRPGHDLATPAMVGGREIFSCRKKNLHGASPLLKHPHLQWAKKQFRTREAHQNEKRVSQSTASQPPPRPQPGHNPATTLPRPGHDPATSG